MFIDNYYTKIYNNIIANARLRLKNDENYYEGHHIIPKCIGGKDSGENIVFLTFREHFICHWLLIKMVPVEVKYKLQFAFYNMSRTNKEQQRKLTSRQYEIVKAHNKEACKSRKKTTGHKMSVEAKQKMRDAKKNKIPIYHDELKIKKLCNKDELNMWLELGYRLGSASNAGIKNPMFGKKHSKETKQKISKKNSRKTLTDDGRNRKSEFSKQNNPMFNPEYAEKARLNRMKKYKLTDPEGNVHFIVGLKAFAEQHKLNVGCLVSVAKGNGKHHKKWLCEKIL